MPQALAIAFPVVFGATGSVALVTAAGTLTLAGSLVSIGGSLLLSVAVNSRNRPAGVDPANVQLTLRQAIGDRIKHVGRVRTGGTIVFYRTSQGRFYRVVVHGHGEIDGIEGYILDKNAITLDGSGFVQEDQYVSDGTDLVQILTRSGLSTETYFSEIEDVWAEWDEDHRLDGLCTSLTIAQSVDANDFGRVYPNREPSLEMILRGAKVRDPRIGGSPAWSENAALIIADLIEDPDGFNLSGLIDDDWLDAAAEKSDDDIPLGAGGTEKRWRISGSYSRTEKSADILSRMRAVCQSDLHLLPSGKIGISVAPLEAPTVTLTRDEVISIDEWVSGPDALDRYTELPFHYVDRNLAYQQTTGDPWIDAARITANGGQGAIGPEADYDLSPSHTQCRRSAQEQIERDNPDHIVTITFKPSARRAMYDQVILLDIAELPSGYWWRVKNFGLDTSNGRLRLVLWSYVRPTWSTGLEGTPQVMPDPDESGDIPMPSNAKAAGTGVDSAAGIAVVWDDRPSVALQPVLRYSVAGLEEWEDWPLDPKSRRTIISPLTDGSDYDLELFWETEDGLKSQAVTFSAVTASTDTAAIPAPTGLSITDETGGEATVHLTTAVSDRLWKTVIYRSGTEVATSYASGGVALAIADAPGAGTYNWTARSLDLRGDQGGVAGPVSQTIT
ncbi:MAG: hypothetical protein CML65_01465 [Rhodobacteraceae bacterium]|nr:hypothetical protein [Paracoccaceae bacterium]